MFVHSLVAASRYQHERDFLINNVSDRRASTPGMAALRVESMRDSDLAQLFDDERYYYLVDYSCKSCSSISRPSATSSRAQEDSQTHHQQLEGKQAIEKQQEHHKNVDTVFTSIAAQDWRVEIMQERTGNITATTHTASEAHGETATEPSSQEHEYSDSFEEEESDVQEERNSSSFEEASDAELNVSHNDSIHRHSIEGVLETSTHEHQIEHGFNQISEIKSLTSAESLASERVEENDERHESLEEKEQPSTALSPPDAVAIASVVAEATDVQQNTTVTEPNKEDNVKTDSEVLSNASAAKQQSLQQHDQLVVVSPLPLSDSQVEEVQGTREESARSVDTSVWSAASERSSSARVPKVVPVMETVEFC